MGKIGKMEFGFLENGIDARWRMMGMLSASFWKPHPGCVEAQFSCETGRDFVFGGGFSLGGGPFREQSALDFGEKADIVRRFEAFPSDFGERSHDVESLFANHFRLRCC